MKENKTLIDRLAEVVVTVLGMCLTVCLCAILVALTVGFLRLVF